MAIRIRQMRRGEWRKYRVATLRRITTSDTGTAWPSTGVTATWSAAQWRDRVRQRVGPRQAYLVAENDDGRWIGTLAVTPAKRAGDRVAQLAGIWVDPDFRGPQPDDAPIVDRMITKAGELARRDWKIRILTLFVADDNISARRAYERNGFRQVGQHEGWIAPATDMELYLEQADNRPLMKPLRRGKGRRSRLRG